MSLSDKEESTFFASLALHMMHFIQYLSVLAGRPFLEGGMISILI